MLTYLDRESPVKALPGLVTASATGLSLAAQTVRFFDDVFEIPATQVAISWPGEPVRYRVVLTKAGLVLAAELLSELPVRIDGEIVYLAELILQAATDTPETVNVLVPRIVCTGTDPESPTSHTVDTPVATLTPSPEVIATRAQNRRMAALLDQVTGKKVSALNQGERNALLELIALKLGLPITPSA